MTTSSSPKTVTRLKGALSTLLQALDGVDEVDARRLDPDSLPRKLNTLGSTKSYWSIEVRGWTDRPAAFGTTDRVVFRAYNVRIEGWHGFAGTADLTEAWQELAERISDELQTAQGTIAQSVAGFQDWRNFGAPELDIVRLGENTRAHHCLFTFGAEVFLRLTR